MQRKHMMIGLKPHLEARLVFNQMLLRSLEILQLPQLELAALIEEEIIQNPLLELAKCSSSHNGSIEPLAKTSLYDHLALQVRESFLAEDPIALEMISDLDERGFLTRSLEDFLSTFRISRERLETTLRLLQTFDPPGIFARNLQESFLIQLERQEKKETFVFKLVRDHFDDLLQGRYAKIKKTLRISTLELNKAIQTLTNLSTRPSASFQCNPVQFINPDLQISCVESKWIVESRGEALPTFRINTEYLHLPSLSKEQKQTMRKFATSAKWLCRSLHRRHKLLISIGTYLVTHRTDFFEGRMPLAPVPVFELSTELGVHESTISRAICNKYIAGPFGLLPLKQFVSSESNRSAKELLQQIVFQESAPLTDDQLAQKISRAGIPIARRTVSKYRKQLKIGSASIRKHRLK